MKCLAFMSQKGGAGKTTLAVHAAVAAVEQGFRVIVMDTDPQRSATYWSNERSAAEPIVVPVTSTHIGELIEDARREGIDLAVIDTAPHTAPDVSLIASHADLIVIPCRPSLFDMAAVQASVEIARMSRRDALFCLSACPIRAREIEEVETYLATFSLPIAPTRIHERRPFARAVSTGRAVTEFEPAGKAADEIRALWIYLAQFMNLERKGTYDGNEENRARRMAAKEDGNTSAGRRRTETPC
jgi:chromosome partitioning protein